MGGMAGAFKGLHQGLLQAFNLNKGAEAAKAKSVLDEKKFKLDIEKFGLDERRVKVFEATEKRLGEIAKTQEKLNAVNVKTKEQELLDKTVDTMFTLLENVMPENTNITPARKDATLKMIKDELDFDASLFFVENSEKGGYNLTTKENRASKFEERKEKRIAVSQKVTDQTAKLNAETANINAFTAKFKAKTARIIAAKGNKKDPTEQQARDKVFSIQNVLGKLDKMDTATSALAAAFPDFAKANQKMTPALKAEIEEQGAENIRYYEGFIPSDTRGDELEGRQAGRYKLSSDEIVEWDGKRIVE